MPAADDFLYKELGVNRDASPDTIRHAYRRLALRHHPDKDPQGTEKFKSVNEAFQVLSDPAKRKKYDAEGYRAVVHRDPTDKENREGDVEGAKQSAIDEFDDFMDGLDDDSDQEIDDLLNWWSDPKLEISNVRSCLRVESDDFFDQLVAVYDQYRLTHHATTNDERSKMVTPVMEQFVESHFGAANRRRLHEWNTHSTLEPVMNGNYTAKNGDFVDAPTRTSPRRLPSELDAVHIRETATFAKFLQFHAKSESDKALKSLKTRHAKNYRKQWKAVEKREKYKSHKEKMAWEGFKTDVDWAEIAKDLVELYEVCKSAKSTGNVTGVKVSELKWQGDMKDYGFPEAWNELVAQHITAVAGVSYKQSTYKPPQGGDASTSKSLQPTVEDEDEAKEPVGARPSSTTHPSDTKPLDGDGDTAMADSSRDGRLVDSKVNETSEGTTGETGNSGATGTVSQDLGELPDATITVEDGGEQRAVFGWRSRGLGKQLYLIMTPANAKTAVIDIVNARLWQKSLQELTKPEHDLGRLKVEKPFLKGMDYSDLKWKAIAVMRRYDEPAGGFASLPETQVIFEVKGEEAGSMKMATRSDMGSVYGKKQVDHDIWSRMRKSKRKPPAAPTRKLNAMMYEEMRNSGSDLDAEDTDREEEADVDDIIASDSDSPKLLTNIDARSAEDPSLEEISVLLQKIMRGKGGNQQQPFKSGARRNKRSKAPGSPVPANPLEAQVLEMEIAEAQKKLDRYKQSQITS